MEINDIEYVDELLRGMESKLGATVPLCLLQPILAGSSSSSLAASQAGGPGGCCTPLRPSERRPTSAESTPVKRNDSGNLEPGDAATFPSTIPEMSPIKQFNVKRQRLEDNCRKLKNDMSALRAMDVSLMKQLLTVYDAVEELRWMIESYDMSDSCESISSSVSESIEQIHEKWMTERRQWQSTSSQNLSSWRDDSRFNINHLGRLYSNGSRSRLASADVIGPTYGLGLRSAKWRSPQTDMNSSFPQFTSGKSNFERQRRSSVDHLPIVPPAESPQSSPTETRQRRSSSGAVEAGVVEGKDGEQQDKAAAEGGDHVTKKPKLLYHSKSSPSFESQLQWAEVTDTAVI